jgi:hypothetical protein
LTCHQNELEGGDDYDCGYDDGGGGGDCGDYDGDCGDGDSDSDSDSNVGDSRGGGVSAAISVYPTFVRFTNLASLLCNVAFVQISVVGEQ